MSILHTVFKMEVEFLDISNSRSKEIRYAFLGGGDPERGENIKILNLKTPLFKAEYSTVSHFLHLG